MRRTVLRSIKLIEALFYNYIGLPAPAGTQKCEATITIKEKRKPNLLATEAPYFTFPGF
jgi:hypothetical protein